MVRRPEQARAPERPSGGHGGNGGDETTSLVVARHHAQPSTVEIKVGDTLAERFEIRRRLGEGGMGVVFGVRDSRQPGTELALKVLTGMGPAGIYRLKAEFRSLANVSHPNLVALHELFCDAGRWFFTMELVEGTDFYSYVRDPAAPEGTCACDTGRLVGALRQLTHAVEAIHAAGKLHRDLKPNNVLVDHQGRLVVVDFGLVRERAVAAENVTEQGFLGTPAYAAPEQLDPTRSSTATDWYAVGVMLYEALTGDLPFTGGAQHAMLSKQRPENLLPPSERVTGVPPDLEALCLRLLHVEPSQRADGIDVLQVLSPAGHVPRSASPPATSSHDLFIGRERELALLNEAFDATCRGEQACVLVTAPSGSGKTKLVENFLAALRESGHAHIFAGRCYSHEQLPYKAFDNIIDELTRYLNRLPPVQSAALLPRDTGALTQVFPVLRRVDAVSHVPHRAGAAPGETQLRERAFNALKQLLGAIADRTPVVLFIDDLQWGDSDSARLLSEILSPPDSPALMLVATCRSEERRTSPVLQALEGTERVAPLRQIELPPLSADQSRRLAERLIENEGVVVPELVERIVAESDGHPLFVRELARYLSEHDAAAGSVSLDEALGARAEQLSPLARELLDLICVAGRPVSRMVLSLCLQADGTAAWNELRASRMVRARAVHQDVMFECYHDRLREEVVRRASDSRVLELHRRLAEAYGSTEPVDAQAAVEHYVCAEMPEDAVPFARQASQQMAQALAFGGAAKLLRLALLYTSEPQDVRALRQRLVELLVLEGESKAAAEVCLKLAADADADTDADAARDWKGRAMELYLASSHEREGRALLDELCAEVGLGRPRSRWSSVLRSLPSWLWLWLTGGPSVRAYERARRRRPSPDLIRRGRLAWSAYLGMVYTDYTLASYYAATALRLASSAGDSGSFAMAYSYWQTMRGALVGRFAPHGQRRSREIAGHAEHYERPLLSLHGTQAIYEAEFQQALTLCEQAEQGSSSMVVGAPSSSALARQGQLVGLYWLGRMGEFRRRLARFRRAAQQADDRNLLGRFQLWAIVEKLSVGDPSAALRHLVDARETARSYAYYGSEDPWWDGIAYLAVGQGAKASDSMRDRVRRYRWTLDARMEINRLLIALFQGLADARAWVETGDVRYERSLRRQQRAAARLSLGLGAPVAAQLGALIALREGRDAEALESLERAQRGFERAGVGAHAASVALRRARLMGGQAGAALEQDAMGRFAELEIEDPETWLTVYAPMLDRAPALRR